MADENGSVIDGLPARRVPFWKTATPQAMNALRAANWRRGAEAGVFTADNDPRATGSFGDIVSGTADNPTAPFPRHS